VRRKKVKNKNELKANKPKKTSSALGKRNRTAGHNYERLLAKEYRELGFPLAKTSRHASKLLDNCKVDIYGIPVNLQAKNVKTSIKYQEIFDSMIELLEKNMPERLEYPLAIFHKKQGEGEYVVLRKSDFYDMIRRLHGQA
jgi:hypothetical protein